MSIILLKTLHFLSLLLQAASPLGVLLCNEPMSLLMKYRHHMFARPLCFSAIWDWEPLSHYGLLALG